MTQLFGMITTRGSARYTPYALESFFDCTTLQNTDRFVLIDNDYSVERGSLPSQVTLIQNRSPLGFAQNANQLVEMSLGLNADLYLMNNDLVFSPGWIEPGLGEDAALVSPLSNRECPYDLPEFKSPMVMELDDYLKQRNMFSQVAQMHRASASGFLQVTVLPFFCVRIPQRIIAALGCFDESFGRGGGEDYDYCLRAYLAGFAVKFTLPAFILHFGGKSSWSGVESRPEQDERELKFRAMFGYKWGEKLMRFILFEDREIIKAGSPLDLEIKRGNHQQVVRELMGDRQVIIKLSPDSQPQHG